MEEWEGGGLSALQLAQALLAAARAVRTGTTNHPHKAAGLAASNVLRSCVDILSHAEAATAAAAAAATAAQQWQWQWQQRLRHCEPQVRLVAVICLFFPFRALVLLATTY